MIRILKIGTLALLLSLAAACTRHKIIPDDELAQIFHDAFLTNAYISTQGGIRLDSLKLYEPIFENYGYTMDDVHYTIGNFSKRKSARLGDVVEQAIKQLDEEGAIYDREVAILDTIDNVARRTFSRVVFSDSLIRMKSLRDSTKLHIRIDDMKPGEYRISLKYLIDSLDENTGLRGETWVKQGDGTHTPPYRFMLSRYRTENFSRTIPADTSSRTLHVNFAIFNGSPKRPAVTLRDVKIEWIPQTAAAVDSLFDKQFNLRIFADEFLRIAEPKDSL